MKHFLATLLTLAITSTPLLAQNMCENKNLLDTWNDVFIHGNTRDPKNRYAIIQIIPDQAFQNNTPLDRRNLARLRNEWAQSQYDLPTDNYSYPEKRFQIEGDIVVIALNNGKETVMDNRLKGLNKKGTITVNQVCLNGRCPTLDTNWIKQKENRIAIALVQQKNGKIEWTIGLTQCNTTLTDTFTRNDYNTLLEQSKKSQ